MTKEQESIYRAYEMSNYAGLDTAYERYSAAKGRAWKYCRDLCERLNGYGLRVVSRNTFVFTAGFDFADPETGVLRHMYITPSRDYAFDL